MVADKQRPICRHWMSSRGPAGSEGCSGQMMKERKRESQRTPCLSAWFDDDDDDDDENK